jgi:hypothetical protein
MSHEISQDEALALIASGQKVQGWCPSCTFCEQCDKFIEDWIDLCGHTHLGLFIKLEKFRLKEEVVRKSRITENRKYDSSAGC